MSDELAKATVAAVTARDRLLVADIAVFEAESDLKSSECKKWIDGLPGKNADERNAFLRAELVGEHIAHQNAKVEQMTAKAAFDMAILDLRLKRDLLDLSRRTV